MYTPTSVAKLDIFFSRANVSFDHSMIFFVLRSFCFFNDSICFFNSSLNLIRSFTWFFTFWKSVKVTSNLDDVSKLLVKFCVVTEGLVVPTVDQEFVWILIVVIGCLIKVANPTLLKAKIVKMITIRVFFMSKINNKIK